MSSHGLEGLGSLMNRGSGSCDLDVGVTGNGFQGKKDGEKKPPLPVAAVHVALDDPVNGGSAQNTESGSSDHGNGQLKIAVLERRDTTPALAKAQKPVFVRRSVSFRENRVADQAWPLSGHDSKEEQNGIVNPALEEDAESPPPPPEVSPSPDVNSVQVLIDSEAEPTSGTTSRDGAGELVPARQYSSDTAWYKWFKSKFDAVAGEDRQIDFEEFKVALQVKDSFFLGRFFTLLDTDGSGKISIEELLRGVELLTSGSSQDKLKFLFRVYDVNNSGDVDREELRQVLESCVRESSIKVTDEDVDELTDALLQHSDRDGDGRITFQELKTGLDNYPGVLDNLTIGAFNWLKPPPKGKRKPNLRYLSCAYVQNNASKIVFIVLFIAANIGLFAYSAYNYRESNAGLIIARGGGMCLNLDCVLVLVLMLRKSMTLLRGTVLARVLPLDQHVLLHKLVAAAIVVLALVHTAGHVGNAVWLSGETNLTVPDIIFTTKADLGWVLGTAPITGVALDVILLVMVVCSLSCVRRRGFFQVFYWTHLLYVPFWVLCIIHARYFGYWFVAPGVIFLIEKLSSLSCLRKARFGRTFITEVKLMPSGVTHLVISRPKNFRFRAGDYVFLQIPDIALQEWHPFTISSAPEMEGEFWVHIRSAGDWTRKLYEHFSQQMTAEDKNLSKAPTLRSRSGTLIRRLGTGDDRSGQQVTRDSAKVTQKAMHVEVAVDGPYGTSSREIFDSEHAVLIGAGIGVTPYASILQSIMFRLREHMQTCPCCGHRWCRPIPQHVMKLKKVDFIWVNRDQRCFEWFVKLLTSLEVEQQEAGLPEQLIDMHMYMTSAHDVTDMKGLAIQMALDVMYQKKSRDMITGLRTRTQPGRPDWNKVFSSLRDKQKGKVKVFFCGSPVMAKVIKQKCQDFGFEFHKENF